MLYIDRLKQKSAQINDYANTDRKKAMLTLEKVDLRIKKIARDREGRYHDKRVKFTQKWKTYRTSKYLSWTLRDLK